MVAKCPESHEGGPDYSQTDVKTRFGLEQKTSLEGTPAPERLFTHLIFFNP
jgi:hypothetical protein